MKKLIAFLCCLTLFFAFGEAGAHADGLLKQAAEAVGTDGLTEGLSPEERQILGDTVPASGYDADGALARLWAHVLDAAETQLHAQFAFALRLLVLIFFCALSDSMIEQKSIREMIALAACCCAAAWIAGDWDSGIAQATRALDRLSDYSRAVLPVLFTAAAAAGGVGSAPVRFAASSLAMEVLMTTSRNLVLPLIYAYLALSLTGCLCDSPLVRGMQRLTKWIAVTAMGGLTTVFCFYVSLSGLIAGSTDALAVKAARTVLSGALPVVGGILSDSAAAMVAAAGVIRNTAGVFALIAVCLICLGPTLFLLLKMLLLRAVGTVAQIGAGGSLTRFLDECSEVFSMLLGLLGSNAVMLFFSLMAGMRAVVNT